MFTRQFRFENPSTLNGYTVEIGRDHAGAYQGRAWRSDGKVGTATAPTIAFTVSAAVGDKGMQAGDSYVSQAAGFNGSNTLATLLP